MKKSWNTDINIAWNNGTGWTAKLDYRMQEAAMPLTRKKKKLTISVIYMYKLM